MKHIKSFTQLNEAEAKPTKVPKSIEKYVSNKELMKKLTDSYWRAINRNYIDSLDNFVKRFTKAPFNIPSKEISALMDYLDKTVVKSRDAKKEARLKR